MTTSGRKEKSPKGKNSWHTAREQVDGSFRIDDRGASFSGQQFKAIMKGMPNLNWMIFVNHDSTFESEPGTIQISFGDAK